MAAGEGNAGGGTTGRSSGDGPSAASGWHPAETAVVLLATLLGALLRLQGMGGDLWFDEAFWAERLVRDELLGDPKRPIGFTLLARFVTLFGRSELHLRAVPFLASVAMIPLAWSAAKRLYGGRWPALPVLVVVTTASTFIDFAKEFKPYVFEAALHLGLVALALSYAERPTLRRLWFVCAATALCTPFATSTVFALPGVLLVCLVAARGEAGRVHARALVGAGGAALACILVLWLWSWSRPVGDPSRWGTRYDVFPVDEPYLRWLVARLRRTVDVAFAAPSPIDLPLLERTLTWFFRLSLPLAAALAVAGRAWRLLALAALPVFVAWLFNLAGKWPFGPFRTNQFVLAYVQLLALYPLGRLLGLAVSRWGRAGAVAASVAAALLLAWRLPADVDHYAVKGRFGVPGEAARTGIVRRAMEVIHARESTRPRTPSEPPVPIVCDPWSEARSWYLRMDPGFAERHDAYFAEHHVWISSTWEDAALLPVVEETLAHHDAFWIVSTWGDAAERRRLEELGLSIDVLVDWPLGYVARVSR